MSNATPERRHDDGDTIRIERPDWMPADRWTEIKAAAINHIDATITALRDPDDVVQAVRDAEHVALAAHENGTCHLSEWSCSYCEADR